MRDCRRALRRRDARLGTSFRGSSDLAERASSDTRDVLVRSDGGSLSTPLPQSRLSACSRGGHWSWNSWCRSRSRRLWGLRPRLLRSGLRAGLRTRLLRRSLSVSSPILRPVLRAPLTPFGPGKLWRRPAPLNALSSGRRSKIRLTLRFSGRDDVAAYSIWNLETHHGLESN